MRKMLSKKIMLKKRNFVMDKRMNQLNKLCSLKNRRKLIKLRKTNLHLDCNFKGKMKKWLKAKMNLKVKNWNKFECIKFRITFKCKG